VAGNGCVGHRAERQINPVFRRDCDDLARGKLQPCHPSVVRVAGYSHVGDAGTAAKFDAAGGKPGTDGRDDRVVLVVTCAQDAGNAR